MVTASQMGKDSWKALKKKHSAEELKKVMSDRGSKGGYPKGRPRKTA